MEKTLIMIKPDGISRKLVGEIISRFEMKNFNLVALKMLCITEEMAKLHYIEHEGKVFHSSLINFITSGPVIAMVWEGENVINISRIMIGNTNPEAMIPGTIRGDYAHTLSENVIHGSDSLESSLREISLFFNDENIYDYKLKSS